MVCVRNFPRGKVLVKVRVMEFGLLLQIIVTELKLKSHSQTASFAECDFLRFLAST